MKSAVSANRKIGGSGRGILLVTLAAVLWSSSGLFAKAPVFGEWDVPTRVALMSFWRALFAALVIVFLVRKPGWSWRMMPMMVSFGAMNWSFLQALVATEATTAIWLQYTAPVYVLLGSVFLFRETIKRRDVWFVVVSFSGLAIILSGQISHASGAGLVYGILAGVFYAGVILSLRGLREFDSAWLVFLNLAATAIAFLPICIMLDTGPVGGQWVYLGGFGVVQLGLPYVLFARGLRTITSHEASLVVLLEPVLVPVWVFLAWRHEASYEPPSLTTLAGAILILASLIARYGSAVRTVRVSKKAGD